MVSNKYDDLLRTGKELFWKYGIRRVTVEEICEKANVSKMTFYKYFRNKDDFTVVLLNRFVDEAMTRYSEIMNSDLDFETKVVKIIEMKMEGVNDVSKEFVSDIMVSGSPEVVRMYKKKSKESLEKLMNDFRKSQAKGEIRKDLKIEFLLYFLNKSTEMINDEHLTSMYDSSAEIIAEIMTLFFYGILPHPGAKEFKEELK